MASLKESDRDAAREDVMAHAERAPGEKKPGEKKPSTAETIHESAVSHDRPMERKSPGAPFALVGLAYLAVLAIIGLIIGIVLFAMG